MGSMWHGHIERVEIKSMKMSVQSYWRVNQFEGKIIGKTWVVYKKHQ